jgi:general nucleoside transport system ATP-binding protein
MCAIEISPEKVVLEARGLSKKFDSLVALDSVDFSLFKGEIRALLGENGAGKSTLCNTLLGFLKPDHGEILVHGKVVKFSSPKDAMKSGIGMVHQDLMLIPNMSVTENLSLVLEGNVRKPLVPLNEVRQKLMTMEESYGLSVNPDAIIENLSVGERQRVEILKSLFVGATILLLDEPTSYLTGIETQKLFESLRKMASEGKSIVFVTHKIDEVMELADTITVMRRGKVVATKKKSEVTIGELDNMILGREFFHDIQKAEVQVGEPVLQLEDVSTNGDLGVPAVRNVSFEVRAGEILCIAGVSGNGQRELDEVITGMRKTTSGKVILNGKQINNRTPDEIRREGVAHVCEEHRMGFIFNFSLKDNLILSPYVAEKFKRGIFLDQKKLREQTKSLIKTFDVVAGSEDTLLGALSGGNRQKFLLARELFLDPKVVMANNPTKGLDVGAAQYIRSVLAKEREKGRALLVISTDLDEILQIADRIAVMNAGKIEKVMDGKNVNLQELAYYMTTTTSSGKLFAAKLAPEKTQPVTK